MLTEILVGQAGITEISVTIEMVKQLPAVAAILLLVWKFLATINGRDEQYLRHLENLEVKRVEEADKRNAGLKVL